MLNYAQGHYLAGLLDGLVLVQYRIKHIRKETESLRNFDRRMKGEFDVILDKLIQVRGRQLADYLSDGG